MRGLNAGAGAQQDLPPRGPLRCAAARSSTRRITGTEPHDLSKLVASIGKVTAALNVHEQQLGELIGNFNTFFARSPSQSRRLQTTVAELPSYAAQHRPRPGLARRVVRADARLRARHPARREARRRRRSRRRCRGSNRCRPRSAPTELGGVAKGLAASDARARAARAANRPALQADRTCSTSA